MIYYYLLLKFLIFFIKRIFILKKIKIYIYILIK